MPRQDGRRRRPRSESRYRTGPPGRPDRDRGGHECPRVAVRLRHNPLHARLVVRRDDAHTCSRPRTPVAGRSGAQRPVAPEASQTPGHPVCGRPIEHDRDARVGAIVMLVATAVLAGRLPRSRLGRRRRRRLVVVHGAARRRGNERLELRARLAVAVRGHSCDAALASRHKGSLANRILRTDVSPPRK